jgi:predicted esterase
MEHAGIQMERLCAVAGSEPWTLVSIQGLHRFYKGRSQEVVASWMTREDRDAMIADNIAYVDAALESVRRPAAAPIVWSGFSQGVPMAFRAALRGRFGAAGIIAVGGEIPPEVASDSGQSFPPVLVARGRNDEWFTAAKFDADVASLGARSPGVTTLVFEGAHEWPAEVSLAAAAFLRSVSGA